MQCPNCLFDNKGTKTCEVCGLHLTNKALQAAWRKGRDAFDADRPDYRPPNPYPDKRGGEHGHVVTFSRAFQWAWEAGFQWALDDHLRTEHVKGSSLDFGPGLCANCLDEAWREQDEDEGWDWDAEDEGWDWDDDEPDLYDEYEPAF